MSRPLTPKQGRLVAELVAAPTGGTRALAEASGYTSAAGAAEAVRSPAVQVALLGLTARTAASLGITAEAVLRRYWIEATGAGQDTTSGDRLRALDRLTVLLGLAEPGRRPGQVQALAPPAAAAATEAELVAECQALLAELAADGAGDAGADEA